MESENIYSLMSYATSNLAYKRNGPENIKCYQERKKGVTENLIVRKSKSFCKVDFVYFVLLLKLHKIHVQHSLFYITRGRNIL